jgi:hypothetical protein
MVALTANGVVWENVPPKVLTTTLTYTGVIPGGTVSMVLWFVPYPPLMSLIIGQSPNPNCVVDAPATKPIGDLSVVQLTWIIDEFVKIADIVRIIVGAFIGSVGAGQERIVTSAPNAFRARSVCHGALYVARHPFCMAA